MVLCSFSLTLKPRDKWSPEEMQVATTLAPCAIGKVEQTSARFKSRAFWMIDDRLSTTVLLFPAEEENESFSDIEAEFWPQRDEVIVSIMDIVQPAKGKDVKNCDDAASSSKLPMQAEDAITFPEDFEIWEDDIYERSMWDDDWEEIYDEERVHTRRSYSAVLRDGGG